MTIAEIQALAGRIRAEIARAVVGQDATVDLLLTALLAGGHMLLEGPPGTAKTFLVQCFARAVEAKFGRIQFTPDLMPGDIIGSNIFDFRSGSFALTPGPVFCDVLLADEINRTPPKTQAALLEAMQERRVTIDGTSYDLGARFMVVATQNPLEHQGTYPLPEAQVDRFMFKQVLGYPSEEEERDVVRRHGARAGSLDPGAFGITPAVSAADLDAALATVACVRVGEPIVDYVVRTVRATRGSPDLESGASPRSAAMLAVASRARAVLDGRDYVIPDDVKALALPVLRHRVVLSPAAEIDGRRVNEVVAHLLSRVEAPR